MTLDAKLKWKEHVLIKKKQELNIKFRKFYWLLGWNTELSVKNKILIYRQILKPVWTYGIELWGCTKKSNIEIIQKFQNKVIRSIINAPWYIRNCDLHRDLHLDTVTEEIKKYSIDIINVYIIMKIKRWNKCSTLMKMFVDSKAEKPTNYLFNYSKYY